ncbi:fructosamine kinase family protein [Microlunatus soli]|nr:fructosamine kinase family protein [Microlunatus soli]
MVTEDDSQRLADRVAELTGTPLASIRPLGGAGFGRAYRATADDGSELFVKATEPLPGAFDHEAYGLRRLGAVAGGARTAAVVAADDGLLILEWVDQAPAGHAAAADFGRRLAVTHAAAATGFGRDTDSVIASEPLPAGNGYDNWPDFYAAARLTPFLERAVARGRLDDRDRRSLQQVIDKLPSLAGAAEPPALLHGDLWSGNVLWTTDEAVLIDPACYGGHRETDLAMLPLFGLPQLDVVLASYQQQAPLADGWQQRIAVHQLFPLLVHAVIFGGSYGAAVGDTARACLRSS